MIASHLRTASVLALFAVLGSGTAEAQGRATRQIAVEPAQAASAAEAQAPTVEAQAPDPSAAQASPAPEAPAAGVPAVTAEAPAAEVPPAAAPETTGALPAQKTAPAAKPIAKSVVKVVTKPHGSGLRHVGYGGSAGYGSASNGRRNCH